MSKIYAYLPYFAFSTSSNSPRYYEHVVTTMQETTSELDDFYRFFRISGMGHCEGGAGAWQIGQVTGGPTDPQHNVLMRMVDWVENGNEAAPESVTGVKYINVSLSEFHEVKDKNTDLRSAGRSINGRGLREKALQIPAAELLQRSGELQER